MRTSTKWMAAAAFLLLALAAPRAKADADPWLGYVFGSYAAPYHVATKATKPQLVGGDWTTSHQLGMVEQPLSLGLVGFGAGIGYNGWNAQFDVRSALDATSGIVTFGYRRGLQVGNIEVWGRLGAGPAVVVDYSVPSNSRLVGGVSSFVEGGADYFLLPGRLGLGLKAAAVPQYTWPATFGADFALNLGMRVLL